MPEINAKIVHLIGQWVHCPFSVLLTLHGFYGEFSLGNKHALWTVLFRRETIYWDLSVHTEVVGRFIVFSSIVWGHFLYPSRGAYSSITSCLINQPPCSHLLFFGTEHKRLLNYMSHGWSSTIFPARRRLPISSSKTSFKASRATRMEHPVVTFKINFATCKRHVLCVVNVNITLREDGTIHT